MKNCAMLTLEKRRPRVLARRIGDIDAWSVAMQQASETTDDDFNIEKQVFLSKLWNPEFFLARYASGTPSSWVAGEECSPSGA